MTDYALPVTGTGSSQAVSVEAHDAEVQRAIDEAVAAESARATGVEAAHDARLDALEAPGSVGTADLADGAATNAKLGAMAAATIKGRAAGAGAGSPQDLTPAQAREAMGLGTAATAGADDFATAAQGALADTAVQPGDNVSSLAETSVAKIMTAAERTKLAGIATGATANATDAALRDRATHTGTQPIASVSGLQAVLDEMATTADLAAYASVTDLGAEADVRDRADVVQTWRPGENTNLWSDVLIGAPEYRTPLTVGSVVSNADGAVLRISGADVPAEAGYLPVAPRTAMAIELNRVYEVRAVVRRAVDPVDPLGHAVELRVRNLSAGKSGVSDVAVADPVALNVADGRVEMVALICRGTPPAGVVAYSPPSTARYVTPHLRIYGNGATTDIEAILWRDVTDTVALTQATSEIASDLADEIADRVSGDAANASAITAHAARADNPHGVTKSQVGLGAADNTADADKPVSGPQQAALDLKANAADLAAEVTARASLIDNFERNGPAVAHFADADGDTHPLDAAHSRIRMEGLTVTSAQRNGPPGLAVVDDAGDIVPLDAPQQRVRMPGIEIYPYERNGPAAVLVVDGAANLSPSSGADAVLRAEVAAARGARDDLAARIDTGLSPDGHPLLPVIGTETLRQCHYRLADLAAGQAQQINIAGIGDSWITNPDWWVGMIAQRLVAEYGDGGGGWTGYGYWGDYTGPWTVGSQPTGIKGNARPASYPVSLIGAWNRVHNGSTGPDLGHVFSSVAGDKITTSVPASPDHTGLRLVWIGTADGVVRHRVDGGSWTTLPVQGGVDTIQSAMIALTPGAHTIEIEVVSGTVRLCGHDALSSASGVRIHKLGGSGSRAHQWVGVDEAQQRAGWQLLGIHAWMILDGTNTQTEGIDPAVWAGTVTELIGRVRAASAVPDVLLIAPAENQRVNAVPMAAYAAAARDVARGLSCAFVDLQPAFGVAPADYAAAGPLPLMAADGIHPNAAGSRSAAAMIYRAITL